MLVVHGGWGGGIILSTVLGINGIILHPIEETMHCVDMLAAAISKSKLKGACFFRFKDGNETCHICTYDANMN